MRGRIGMVLCILFGSFCVYCSQSMMTSHGGRDGGAGGGRGGDGSAIGDAMAQANGGGTCCTPPPRETPTVIFDDVVAPGPRIGNTQSCPMMSPVLDVSAYRTIVVHTPTSGFTVQVRNGKAGFVTGATGAPATVGPLANALVIDTILGHDMRVNFANTYSHDPDGSVDCGNTAPVAVTIVGYH